MKKGAALLLAVLLGLSLFCACKAGQEKEGALPAPVNQGQVTADISLHLRQDSYPVGTESFTLVLENRGADTLLYGQGWVFEKYEKGEWVSLPEKENCAFTSEGYILGDHDRQTLTLSTFMLTNPLTEGLYRITGCAMRVSASEDGIFTEEQYTAYPPYELQFLISEEAEPESTEALLREDWQWHTLRECAESMAEQKRNVWQYVDDGKGAAALLWSTGDTLIQGEKLCLSLYDRINGTLLSVFEEPTAVYDGLSVLPEGGFLVSTGDGAVTVRLNSGKAEVQEAEAPQSFLDGESAVIRTDGFPEGVSYPKTVVIRSAAELNAYYEDNKELYDLASRETVYADSTPGFADVMGRYDEAFFVDHALILCLIEESSGSVRLGLQSACLQEGALILTIERQVPEMGTCDMALWHVFAPVLLIAPLDNIQVVFTA